MSDSLWAHGLQHSRPPCPSPSPWVCPSSYSLHWWCRPAISSSDTLFSFCPQSSQESGAFPMSRLFTSDDQNIGASALPSVFPVNIQGWPPLRLTGLISLLSKGFSGVFSSTTVQRHPFFGILLLYGPVLKSIGDHWEDLGLDYMDLCRQGDISTFQYIVIAFLPRSNHLLVSWLWSLSAEILEAKKRKYVTVSTFFPSISHAIIGSDATISVFFNS